MLPKGIEYVAIAFVVLIFVLGILVGYFVFDHSKPVCYYCDEHENGYVCEIGVCPSLDKVVKVSE